MDDLPTRYLKAIKHRREKALREKNGLNKKESNKKEDNKNVKRQTRKPKRSTD